MKRILTALLMFCLFVPLGRAEEWLAPANGLTIATLGASNMSVGSPYPAGLDQGFAFVGFVETVAGSGWSSTSCLNQQFFLAINTAGGRALYQVLLMAAALGKKLSTITVSAPNPSASGICMLTWAVLLN